MKKTAIQQNIDRIEQSLKNCRTMPDTFNNRMIQSVLETELIENKKLIDVSKEQLINAFNSGYVTIEHVPFAGLNWFNNLYKNE